MPGAAGNLVIGRCGLQFSICFVPKCQTGSTNMRTIIFSVIFVSLPAFANDKADPIPQPAPQALKQEQAQITNGGDSSSSSSSSATANGTGGAASSDNAVSFRDRIQAPPVFAPAVYASGPCNIGWSAGASAPGAGLSFGRSKSDTSCDRRELARIMSTLNPAAALKILCADPIAREVLTDSDCVYMVPPDTSKPTVVILDGNGHATKEELRRAFEGSLGK